MTSVHRDEEALAWAKARHIKGCRGWAMGYWVPRCGGAFRCEGCGRLVGWCDGAADDMPEHCSRCANAAHTDPRANSRGFSQPTVTLL